MTTRFSVVSLMCLWLQAPGTSAHHSFATHYDYDREIVITGVVTSARLANPHSFFAVDVTVSEGSIESWEIEGNSIPLLTRAGITRDTFQVGDVVTVTGMLSRDPDRKLMFGLVADAADGESCEFAKRCLLSQNSIGFPIHSRTVSSSTFVCTKVECVCPTGARRSDSGHRFDG